MKFIPLFIGFSVFGGLLPAHAENPKFPVFIVENLLGQKVPIFDADNDGWHDLWVGMFPEITQRDHVSDTDEDGVSDYDEMLLWRDPMVKGPIPRKFTALEMQEIAVASEKASKVAKAERAVFFAKRKAELKPRIQASVLKEVSDVDVKFEEKLKFAKAVRLKVESDTETWRRDTGFVGPKGSYLDSVRDGIPVVLSSDSGPAGVQANTSPLHPGGATGLNLTGQGFPMGVFDFGSIAYHNEFSGRFLNQDVNPVHVHATGMAGIMVATGLNSFAKGMSPASNVYGWTYGSLLSKLGDAVDAGVFLSNHSYSQAAGWTGAGILYALDGVNYRPVWYGDVNKSLTESYIFGSYSFDTWYSDIHAYDNPEYLTVWSAGNERSDPMPVGPTVPYYTYQGSTLIVRTGVIPGDGEATGGFDTIGPFNSGKNSIAVGAVDINGSLYFGSSFGPTDDGRVKPDLVAKGADVVTTYATDGSSYSSKYGTSFSAPVVTGSVNLLRQLRSNLGFKPLLSSSLKGVAIHTATDLGLTGPDYKFGWGLINTQKAAELLVSDSLDAGLSHVKEAVLQQDDSVEFEVVATGSGPLKVTICWTERPGDPTNSKVLNYRTSTLVNKINVEVLKDSTVYYPWVLDVENPSLPATKGVNTVDNVKQVLIDNTVSGEKYTVKVTHTDTLYSSDRVTGQQVSIIVSGNESTPVPAFQVHTIEQTGEEEMTLFWKSVVGANYQIETSTDLESWVALPDVYNASKEEMVQPVVSTSPTGKRFWRVVRLAD
jgi:Subtilase family